MALAGIHVVCAQLGSRAGAALLIYPDWSETLAAPGVTARASKNDGYLLQVSAGVDAFFAVGRAPDASNASGDASQARYFIAAGTTREVFCSFGDKLAWVAA